MGGTLTRQWFLVSGLVLIGIYFGSIAAAPIVYLLVGSAFPSLINLSLSAWAVSFTRPTVLRCLLFIPVSFLLGLNIFLPTFLQTLVAHPQIEQIVYRKVRLDPSLTSLRLETEKNGGRFVYFVANPLTSPVEVGGDEGCMCMYFKIVGGYYLLGFERQLTLSTGKRWAQAGDIFKLAHRAIPEVSFWFDTYPIKNDAVDVVLEIRDKDGTASKFIHRNVRIIPSEMEQRASRSAGLHNGYLISNASWILIGGSFWNFQLGTIIPQYPDRYVSKFLKDAVDSLPENSFEMSPETVSRMSTR